MKLLFDYTLDYIRRNRRSSCSIMIAILMTATMLSAMCGFFFNSYTDNLRYVLQETGNWHGELFDETLGDKLPVIQSFDSVESLMIKGAWRVAQIEDPRRDYLVWRDANTAYWESMPEGDQAILSGRVPTQAGEIALSKQYFEHHPQLQLGDSLTLPLGNRVAPDGSVIPPQAVAVAGERFVQTETVTLTVVGELDVATSSTVPAYTALGYLAPEGIFPEDDITVYFRFHHVQDTYKELPRIAEAVGYTPDEYGNYMLRYNTDYLLRRAVLSPEQADMMSTLWANQMPLSFGVMGILVAALFVLIIHNAFALSSSTRLSQLGIFASVGATPKQIQRSVVMEAFLLTAIPLPVGLLLGQLAVFLFVAYSNTLNATSEWGAMEFAVGWQSLLPAILLTLCTVWWSALIPAKKIAKMSPIVAIRQGGNENLQKPRRFLLWWMGRLFGLSGELAANALQARKKSYRTSTLSLCLSFLILTTFLCINSASTASKAIYQSEEKRWAERDILLSLYNVATPEDYATIIPQIEAQEQVEVAHWYSTLRTVVWLPEEGFSPQFHEKGGFPAAEKYIAPAQLPLLEEGKRRVGITLLGLDDQDFSDYCTTLGIDPSPFFQQDHWRGILYHTVQDVVTSTKRTPVLLPLLDIKPGDSMTLTEKALHSYEGDFAFPLEIGAVAEQMPPVGGATFGNRYSAIQILPMSRLRQLATHFTKSNIVRVDGVIEVSDPALILDTRAELEQLCESYFGSGDYQILDEVEYFQNQQAGQTTVTLLFGFVILLFTVIGLSNAWATVRNTLNARRREFAMLRSVGLPPLGLRRMLLLEAMLLGFAPLLLGIPVGLVLQSIFLQINEVTFFQWLPFAPWLPILLYICSILGVMVVAYGVGGRRLERENIIQAILLDLL